jgi:hypothetical protein
MTNQTINADEKDPGGRPTDYKPEFADQARKLCKLGAIDEELADFFEVTIRTIHRWKSKHPEFGKAIKVGKKRADNRVKMALYRRAVGFFTTETKVFQYKGEPVTATIDVQVLPDVRAATIWLVNREGWRMSHQVGGEIEDGPEPKSITVEVVDARLRSPDQEGESAPPD